MANTKAEVVAKAKPLAKAKPVKTRRYYFDWNATAPLAPSVVKQFSSWGRAPEALLGNPSSAHREGRRQRAAIEAVRARLETQLDAHQIVFTSGATEANNHAITAHQRGIAIAANAHASARAAAAAKPHVTIDINQHGQLRLEPLETALRANRVGMLSTPLICGETGIILDLADAVSLCRQHEAWVHLDATQALGRAVEGIELSALDWDMLSFSAHKIGGLAGCGGLALRPAAEALSPLVRGGGQENAYRSGTENLIGILALNAALDHAEHKTTKAAWQRTRYWRDRLEARLRQEIGDSVFFIGAEANRTHNTSCIAFTHGEAQLLMARCDLAGIAISAGSACASGRASPSFVLPAMGVPTALAESAVRLSFGPADSMDTTHMEAGHMEAGHMEAGHMEAGIERFCELCATR